MDDKRSNPPVEELKCVELDRRGRFRVSLPFSDLSVPAGANPRPAAVLGSSWESSREPRPAPRRQVLTVNAATHIGHSACQPDTNLARGRDHRRANTTRTRASAQPPSYRSTITRTLPSSAISIRPAVHGAGATRPTRSSSSDSGRYGVLPLICTLAILVNALARSISSAIRCAVARAPWEFPRFA